FEPLVEADELNYHSHYKNVILTVFKKTLPGKPRNLEELDQMLQEYRPMCEFYKGIAKADDDSIDLVFIHDSRLEALSECTQLFCNGTFDVYLNLW
ncbi:hypothetical protein TSAR_009588, partial [Trichomalopsis sarcophagae]